MQAEGKMMNEFSKPSRKGVPVQGKELAIVNSAVFRLCRRHGVLRQGSPRVLALKNEMPVQVTPCMINALAEALGSTFTEETEPEEDDDDWEGWGFREQDK